MTLTCRGRLCSLEEMFMTSEMDSLWLYLIEQIERWLFEYMQLIIQTFLVI